MIFVTLPWSGSYMDSYIVHIDGDASFVNEVVEYGVYYGLKGGGGVGETKEHDRWFVESFIGDEGCLPSVLGFDEHLVVSPFNVETSEQ